MACDIAGQSQCFICCDFEICLFLHICHDRGHCNRRMLTSPHGHEMHIVWCLDIFALCVLWQPVQSSVSTNNTWQVIVLYFSILMCCLLNLAKSIFIELEWGWKQKVWERVHIINCCTLPCTNLQETWEFSAALCIHSYATFLQNWAINVKSTNRI